MIGPKLLQKPIGVADKRGVTLEVGVVSKFVGTLSQSANS